MLDMLNTATSESPMTSEKTCLVHDSNISHAWGALLVRLIRSARGQCGPVAVCLSGFPEELPSEDLHIREALDELLCAHGKYPCSVSSMIVFPYREWIGRGRPPCGEFSTWCIQKFAPRLRSCNRQNRRGLYFERMMNFRSSADGDGGGMNQLLHIVDWWNDRRTKDKARPPHSRMQVACFDPFRDHNHECRPWFPCLQQVSFLYDEADRLAVCAYYPTQYVFDRAYGNLLGLSRLGAFMVDQLHMRFTELTCFVGRASLGGISKKAIAGLAKLVERSVQEQ